MIDVRRPFYVGGVQFEAFRLEHSIRAPAVGYRLNAGGASVFYSPDVASIHEAHEALAGIQFYIGDGAAITRPTLRKRDHALIGHASIRMQLEWCRTERVPAAIFTHCGSEIVKGDQRRVEEKIAALGEAAGVDTFLPLTVLKSESEIDWLLGGSSLRPFTVGSIQFCEMAAGLH